MNKIIVAYWMGSPYKDLKYKHNEEFPYSTRKRNLIVDRVLAKGYHVMLLSRKAFDPSLPNDLMIWIDNGKFRQR